MRQSFMFVRTRSELKAQFQPDVALLGLLITYYPHLYVDSKHAIHT